MRVLDNFPRRGEKAGLGTDEERWDVSVSIRWSPMEFVEQARAASHPFDREGRRG